MFRNSREISWALQALASPLPAQRSAAVHLKVDSPRARGYAGTYFFQRLEAQVPGRHSSRTSRLALGAAIIGSELHSLPEFCTPRCSAASSGGDGF